MTWTPPEGWEVFGMKNTTSGIDGGWPPFPRWSARLLTAGREGRIIYCITWTIAKGGWCYRNEWAAMTAFEAWDGKGAPAAGEWHDF